MDEMICSECHHPFTRHVWRMGCVIDWEAYWANLPYAEEGCPCKLAHVDYSPTEGDKR